MNNYKETFGYARMFMCGERNITVQSINGGGFAKLFD